MTRATLVRLIAAILVLTAVTAVPMTQIHWDGTQGSAEADDIDTLLNVMIVLSCFVFAIVLGDLESKASDRLRVDVTAQQYKWTFNYPQDNGKVVSSNVLVVPEDRQLDLRLTALDVIHAFWVPEWRIKRDLVPAGSGGNDVDNTVQVTPDRLGTYNVVCTELCGIGHSTMRALVRVVPEGEFNSWLGRQQPVEPQPGSASGATTGASSSGESGSTGGT